MKRKYKFNFVNSSGLLEKNFVIIKDFEFRIDEFVKFYTNIYIYINFCSRVAYTEIYYNNYERRLRKRPPGGTMCS
jgi:hypothetical protein